MTHDLSSGSRPKAVVISGASTGIGQACALHLDKLGWRVFAGIRRVADGEALRRRSSQTLEPVFIDVTDAASIAAVVEMIAPQVEPVGLAGLINNAGIAVGGPLEFLPIDRLRTQFEINVVGQIALTQACLPLLRQGRGRVINMSSISGRLAMPFFGPYAASKFALEALTDSLRLELSPWGLEVVSIEPGSIATPIWQKSIAKADKMRQELPEQGQALYGATLDRLRGAILKTGERGIPPEAVARVVAEALTAKRPKTRYLIGRDAKLGAFIAWLLPDRLRDWMVAGRSRARRSK